MHDLTRIRLGDELAFVPASDFHLNLLANACSTLKATLELLKISHFSNCLLAFNLRVNVTRKRISLDSACQIHFAQSLPIQFFQVSKHVAAVMDKVKYYPAA